MLCHSHSLQNLAHISSLCVIVAAVGRLPKSIYMIPIVNCRFVFTIWVNTWTLWAAATLTQDQCVLETAQSLRKVYPPGELYGYGNSGLYRTYGVTVHVKCTFTNTANAKETVHVQIKDHKGNVLKKGTYHVESMDYGETLVYKVTDLKKSAGFQYTCHCAVDGANVQFMAIEVAKIPFMYPCHEMCAMPGDVCYHWDLWPQSFFQQCPQFHSQLQSIHWNDGAPVSRIYDASRFDKFSWWDILVPWSSTVVNQGLCVSKHNQTIPTTHRNGTCELYFNVISEPSQTVLPYGRAMRACFNSFLHSSIPMQLNGREVYVGAIYYILEQETDVLSVNPGYEPATVGYDQFECTMYSWREGTDIQDARSRRLKPNFESNTTSKGKTWNINGKDIPTDVEITMIACTHKAGVINESFPLDVLFEGQQVEFFVNQLRGNKIWEVVPHYSKHDNFINTCSVMKGSTSVAMTRVIEADGVNCKCKFADPIVACNPIKTVLPADNYSLVFQCYGPVTTTQTAATQGQPRKSLGSTTYIWIIVGIGLGIIFFVLLIYVTHLNLKERRIRRKIEKRLDNTYQLSDDNTNLMIDSQGENSFFKGCKDSDPVVPQDVNNGPAVPAAKSVSAKKENNYNL